jgi:hypothetical protein
MDNAWRAQASVSAARALSPSGLGVDLSPKKTVGAQSCQAARSHRGFWGRVPGLYSSLSIKIIQPWLACRPDVPGRTATGLRSVLLAFPRLW